MWSYSSHGKGGNQRMQSPGSYSLSSMASTLNVWASTTKVWRVIGGVRIVELGGRGSLGQVKVGAPSRNKEEECE